jgi:ankyrin repeat protein
VNECGANVDEQDNRGNTPLHVACSYGYRNKKRTDIVEALMALGADVNIINDFKQTPAQAASDRGHNELRPLLNRLRAMDTNIRSRQLIILQNSISVYLTALFVQSYKTL